MKDTWEFLQNEVRNPAKVEGTMIHGIVSDDIGMAIAKPILLPATRYEERLKGKGNNWLKIDHTT